MKEANEKERKKESYEDVSISKAEIKTMRRKKQKK